MAEKSTSSLHDLVLSLAEPLVSALGLVIWGIEITHANHSLVRIFIDGNDPLPSDKTANELHQPSIDQCERISRDLGLALDVEDCFPEAWTLEVSTPGLDRTFFSLSQMQAYVGDVVCARMLAPYPSGQGGRKTWRGLLQDVSDDAFTIQPVQITNDDYIEELAMEPVTLPWSALRRVNRVALFPKPEKPGKASSRKKRRNTGKTPENN
ncbi:MAG: ribosome maturation factor RimP [Desulfovibrio sp.]|nr:ribosome maturation factor RimP [Desulfovibrio sp.]